MIEIGLTDPKKSGGGDRSPSNPIGYDGPTGLLSASPILLSNSILTLVKTKEPSSRSGVGSPLQRHYYCCENKESLKKGIV